MPTVKQTKLENWIDQERAQIIKAQCPKCGWERIFDLEKIPDASGMRFSEFKDILRKLGCQNCDFKGLIVKNVGGST